MLFEDLPNNKFTIQILKLTEVELKFDIVPEL